MTQQPMAPVAAREVFGERCGAAQAYHDLLAGPGIEWGLLGPREVERLWERHLLNSAALSELLPAGANIVDVGSGAGLPGIPLGLAREDVEITLLEPQLRRYNFLSMVVDKLGITPRVTAVRGRAEDCRGRYDVVVSRALAPLPRLVEWCEPLAAECGSIVCLKGKSAAEELAKATKDLAKRRLTAELLSVRAHPLTEPTTAIRIVHG